MLSLKRAETGKLLAYCLMHQLFIVNGYPGARNSVDRIFIGKEPLQQLWRSGEFLSRMRFFSLTILRYENFRVAWSARPFFSIEFFLDEYCTAPRLP